MKKVFGILLCVLIAFSSLAVCAGAEGKTVFYLDYGDVDLYDTAVSGYDENGNMVTTCNENGYVITQKDSSVQLDRSVTISSGSQSVELKDVNILRSGSFNYAICVLSGAEATFILRGENHIKAGLYRAGLDISQTASAIIEGDGILYAESEFEAGIGGGNGKSNGTLIINSGTVYATGGISGYSAGIGGGTAGTGGSITINGGNIIAVGGERAAGIGGGNTKSGGTIVINGGTVTATGGYSGAGIGGGYLGNGGTIIINGGSVKGIAGYDASSIGNGQNCKTDFIGYVNSNSEALYLVNADFGDFISVNIDGINQLPITSKHSNDDNLYLFLTSGEHIATVKKSDSEIEYYTIAVTELSAVITKLQDVDYNGNVRNNDIVLMKSVMQNIVVPEQFTMKYNENGNLDFLFNDIVVDTMDLLYYGDVNEDGLVNATDSLLVLMSSVQQIKLNDVQSLLADMNSDGKINSYDALVILELIIS